VGALDLQFV